MKACARSALHVSRHGCFCLLAIRKMINDARNEVELSAHPAVARATEWSETRPAFHAVFRHAVVVPVVVLDVSVVVRVPGNFTVFSLVLVETTCDDVEHTWREQVREKSAVRPPQRGKAYAVNGCRLGSARKILIKVRYLAKRSYLTAAFFPFSHENECRPLILLSSSQGVNFLIS